MNPLCRGFGIRRSTDELHAVPAGGIEPLHDRATTRCIPIWLSRRVLAAEAGIEPAADEAYETSALPLSYSAPWLSNSRSWLPLLDLNQALRVQSPVPCQLDEGATSHVDSNHRSSAGRQGRAPLHADDDWSTRQDSNLHLPGPQPGAFSC